MIGSIAHTAGSGKLVKSPAAVSGSATSARALPSVSAKAAAASRVAAKTRAVIPAAAAVQAATVPAPPALTAATGCYPVTGQGACYEPGDACRGIDHGTSGVAGDGAVIDCTNRDGWRWQRA